MRFHPPLFEKTRSSSLTKVMEILDIPDLILPNINLLWSTGLRVPEIVPLWEAVTE